MLATVAAVAAWLLSWTGVAVASAALAALVMGFASLRTLVLFSSIIVSLVA